MPLLRSPNQQGPKSDRTADIPFAGYATLSGLASDDVASHAAFLGTGETQPIPLRDNALLTQAAHADYPIRVVVYDREDRIIGIQTLNTP